MKLISLAALLMVTSPLSFAKEERKLLRTGYDSGLDFTDLAGSSATDSIGQVLPAVESLTGGSAATGILPSTDSLSSLGDLSSLTSLTGGSSLGDLSSLSSLTSLTGGNGLGDLSSLTSLTGTSGLSGLTNGANLPDISSLTGGSTLSSITNGASLPDISSLTGGSALSSITSGLTASGTTKTGTSGSDTGTTKPGTSGSTKLESYSDTMQEGSDATLSDSVTQVDPTK